MQKEMSTPTRSILLGLITVALTLPPIYLLASMSSLNWVRMIFLIINLPYGAIMDSLVVSDLLPISSPLRPSVCSDSRHSVLDSCVVLFALREGDVSTAESKFKVGVLNEAR